MKRNLAKKQLTGGRLASGSAVNKKPSEVLASAYVKLVALEFVLSAVFFTIGHVIGNMYLRGVGVGLLIAWASGAIAYFVAKRKAGSG